jgi:putative membrane protein
MLNDALLAFFHYFAIFALVATLTAEAVTLRPGMSPAGLKRVALYDLVYFVSAMAVLASGLLRLFYGAKGAPFYVHNPWFHAKVTLFVVIALCSLPPTLRLQQWRRQARALPDFVPMPSELKATRRWVMIEAHLLILLPLCAVMMARGIGLR